MTTTRLRARHVAKYAELGQLLLKHRNALRIGRPEGPAADGATMAEDADELARRLEELGPTFVKLGQLLSTRADLLPPPYLAALARLQERVSPIDSETARQLIEDELGVRASVAFSSFEDAPIASASLGQVHRAQLRDGRSIAVKVQRPDARVRVLDDLEVLDELAHFVERHDETGSRIGFRSLVEEFRRSLLDELDYRYEAANLRRMAENLAEYELIVVPQPIGDFTTDRVLTMELLEGRSVGSLGPLAHTEIDGEALLEELFKAYLDQVLVYGFFHADPHPGNLLLLADGRLGLIDLGMVAHVTPGTRSILLRLLFAIADGAGEDAADALEQMSEILADFDRRVLRREVAALVQKHAGATAATIQTGRLLGEVGRIATQCGLRSAPELTLVMKALLNLDEVARGLDPNFEPNSVIRAHAVELMRRHMREEASPRKLLTTTLEAKEFVEHLPSRLNRVMDSVAEGRFSIRFQGFDDPELMRGIQKLANRVTAGIVLAALVVSAALFSGSHADEVGGYPLLTVVFLALAAVGAIWLACNVVRADVRNHRSRGHGGSATPAGR